MGLFAEFKARLDVKDVLLALFFIVSSLVVEYQWKLESVWLPICTILASTIYLIRTKKHDNIMTVAESDFYPIIGHLLIAFKTMNGINPYQAITQWIKDTKLKIKDLRAVSICIPLQNFVLLLDPDDCDKIFTKDFDCAVKGPIFRESFAPMLGNGIFASDGKIWKSHRAIASRIFSVRALKYHMFECFMETTDTFMNKLEELSKMTIPKDSGDDSDGDSDGDDESKYMKGNCMHFNTSNGDRVFMSNIDSDNDSSGMLDKCQNVFENLANIPKLGESRNVNDFGNRINLFDMFNRLTLEAFTYIAFGVKLGCIEKAPENLEFATSFDRAFVIIIRRFLNPFWKILKTLNVGVESELNKHINVVNKFVNDVIQKRQDLSYRNQLAKKYDLLSHFINDKTKKYSIKELRDISVNFIIAGRDTTAQLLSWTVYELCMSPEIQIKIRNEISSVTPNGDITYDNVSQFKYLECVLLEALRLHPSVPVLLRFATREIKLKNGQTIHKNDVCFFVLCCCFFFFSGF